MILSWHDSVSVPSSGKFIVKNLESCSPKTAGGGAATGEPRDRERATAEYSKYAERGHQIKFVSTIPIARLVRALPGADVFLGAQRVVGDVERAGNFAISAGERAREVQAFGLHLV